MKKISVLFFALLLSAASITAKQLPIVGKWLLTIAEVDGHNQEVYSEVVFKEDGYAEMDGRVFGTWDYDKKSKSITIESKMIEEFAGKRTVSNPSKSEMMFSGDGLKLHFLKLDEAKIKKENEESGLLGLWKFESEGETTSINFEAPDVISYFNESEYSTSSGKGVWMFNSAQSSVILILNNRALSGNNSVESITGKSFNLIKNDRVIEVTKIQEFEGEMEPINFTEDDVYKSIDSGDEKFFFDGFNYIWKNAYEKTNYLKHVQSLSYRLTNKIASLNAFVSNEITTKISVDEQEQQASLEPIFGQFSSEYLSPNNLFYPLEIDNTYRIVGDEIITVPAGTFACKVVDAVSGFDGNKLKLYMITNRPGVYAKIIVAGGEEEDATYQQYELSRIEDDYAEMEPNKLIGIWNLVKIDEDEEVKEGNRSLEFVNDGRYIFDGEMGTWEYKDKLYLTSYGDRKEFKITSITEEELGYTDGYEAFFFVKRSK